MNKNKPVPKDHPLHHASKELIAAVDFYTKMGNTQFGDFAAFDSAWREFLQKIERVWNKAEAAMHNNSRWKHLESELKHLRKNDPLLVYLRHARNADEHSLQPVAADWDANLRLSQVEGNRIKAEWNPWSRPLLPVANRGVTYPPPREHLGEAIPDAAKMGRAEALIAADLALNFYKNALNRIVDEVFNAR